MLHKAYSYIFIGLVGFAVFTGCSNRSKFDRQKWSYGDGLEYPLRDEVLEDLMANHHIKGLTLDQVIDSLGAPQRRDSLKFTYQILDNSFEFGQKNPIYKKNLVVYFNKDSVATKFEISEYKEKKKKD
jgi:outer membrane protein assembly factor BamE (lipoprotein component of BamABCDE complex)